MSRVLEAELPERWGVIQRWKNTAIYHALRAAVWSVRIMPFWLARHLARLLGWIASVVDHPDRRRAESNLAAAFPTLPKSEHRRIAQQMFVHLAVSAIELVHIERFLTGPHAVELTPESRAVFDEAFAGGKGVIAVSGHLGNWELLAQVIAHEGFPVTSIAKPLYDPRLTRWVNDHRTAHGHRILWRGDDGVPKELLRVFRANGVLGLLIDQDTRVQGEFVPFFGRPAHTPTAAASLALRTGAAIVVGHGWREKNEHRLHFEHFQKPEGEFEQAVIELTAGLTAWLERAIRKVPSQWVWLHDRWRRQP